MSGTSNENKKQKKDAPIKKTSSAKQQLTATQLRNARKRRAKQNKEASSATKASDNSSDPSAQYLDSPKSAPLVEAAKHFFAEHLTPPFAVYQNGPKTGWRTVSKLPVRSGSQGKVAIGMFQPQTHTIAAAAGGGSNSNATSAYPAHHPSINLGISALTQACQEKGIQPYEETTGTGFLRYVAMNTERSTGKVQMALIWKDEPYEHLNTSGKKRKRKASSQDSKKEGQLQLERLISHLLKHFTATKTLDGEKDESLRKRENTQHPNFELHSLWVHYNAAWKHSNAIFDIHASKASWQHLYGSPRIAEQLTLPTNCKLPYQPTLHFAPNVFRQANLDAFAHILTAIRKRLHQQFPEQQPKLVELYGGVGTLGLHLLDLVSDCICSDENPYNRACFQASMDLLPKSYSKKSTYVPQNASDMVTDRRQFLKDCQVVLVDPPRKGLEDTVLDALVDTSRNKLELLVYVSCGFDAFQRDFKHLTKHGKWTLEHAEGHILFPGANAIETLAFFTPNK
jgi:tRNA/tmRNA/rRNA uracil-C5-methylase (TrmA/RlmC/RlmD family)